MNKPFWYTNEKRFHFFHMITKYFLYAFQLILLKYYLKIDLTIKRMYLCFLCHFVNHNNIYNIVYKFNKTLKNCFLFCVKSKRDIILCHTAISFSRISTGEVIFLNVLQLHKNCLPISKIVYFFN